MKRFLLPFLVPILLVTMLSVAHAGVTAESFSVSPYLGGYSFLGREHLETRPVYGVRAGYNFTKNFGTEAVFDFVKTEGEVDRGHIDVYNWHLDALYHFMPAGPVVPYLAAGYGGQSRDSHASDVGDSTHGAFNYGGGVKFFVRDGLAVRGDVRGLLLKHDEHTFHNVEYTVGVDFLFGGVKPMAAAVAQPAPPQEEPPPVVPPQEPAPGHFKYCITLHGEFDIDQALIRPEYRPEIARVGDFMKKYPTTTAVIEGHTDNVGSAEHNLDLSQRRAEAVVNDLVENFGIERSRLSAKGYGLSRPVADNATDAGRQQNRRIEAIIDCAFDTKEVQPPERLCIAMVLDFDSGSAAIKPQYRDEIAKVGEYLKSYPTTTAVIEGHTDNTGSAENNMKLSQDRAQAVVDYLVQNFGIEASRLSAKGYGSTRRVAYNSTAEGRAKNRRINAVIDCVVKK